MEHGLKTKKVKDLFISLHMKYLNIIDKIDNFVKFT